MLLAACAMALALAWLQPQVAGQQADISDDDDSISPSPEFETCVFKTNDKDGNIVQYDISPLKISCVSWV